MLKIEDPYAPIEVLNLSKFKEHGLSVFIKREDLSHPFISGNKWRKLKYHLLAAQQKNKTSLLTFGGAYSNHVLATAAAGAKYGFKTTAIIRGEKLANPILNLCEMFGMDLLFISRTEYRNKEAFALCVQTENQYIIPEGGGGELGEEGAAEIVEEWEYDHLFCAVGTGSTLRGLLKGMMQKQNKGLVNGIVVLKGAEGMQDDFSTYPTERFRLHFNYHGGGYAKTSPELLEFIRSFASETGILLDQVYEAKMMIALIDLIDKGYFKKGQKILALHNGGLSGLLSQL